MVFVLRVVFYLGARRWPRAAFLLLLSDKPPVNNDAHGKCKPSNGIVYC